MGNLQVEKSEGEGGTVWGVCPRWRRRRGGAGVTMWQGRGGGSAFQVGRNEVEGFLMGGA